MHPARPRKSPKSLRDIDARLQIILLVAGCLVCQYLPQAFLLPWLALLAAAFLRRELRTGATRMLLRGGIVFTLFWLAMKFLSDVIGGTGPATALFAGLPLAGRLLALTMIGALFVGVSSPLATGRAVAWFIRPVAGDAAWKPALVVSLVAWFLPQTLSLAGQVSAGMRARGVRLGPVRKAFVVCGTALRILQRRSEELAVGLASRRLDDSRSWL